MTHLPGLVTLLTIVLMAATMGAVGYARNKYRIKAPAITGDPAFERALRVQVNTIEAAMLFLPTLWLAANYGFSGWAGVAGLVWIVGRVWFALAYLRDPGKRGPAFVLSMLGWAAILVMACVGVTRAMMIS